MHVHKKQRRDHRSHDDKITLSLSRSEQKKKGTLTRLEYENQVLFHIFITTYDELEENKK